MSRMEKLQKQFKIERKAGNSVVVAYENALMWLEIEELMDIQFEW